MRVLVVLIHVAILYNTALPNRHKANNFISVLWQGLDNQIKLFYKFKRYKKACGTVGCENSVPLDTL